MQSLPLFTLEALRDGVALAILIGVVGLSCVALGG